MMLSPATPLLSSSAREQPGYQATTIPIDSGSLPQETVVNGITQEPLITESNNSATNDLQDLSALIENSNELRRVRIADFKRFREISSEADNFSHRASIASRIGQTTLFLTAIFSIISRVKELEKEHESLTKVIVGVSCTIGIMFLFFSSHLSNQASLMKRLATRITKDLG